MPKLKLGKFLGIFSIIIVLLLTGSIGAFFTEGGNKFANEFARDNLNIKDLNNSLRTRLTFLDPYLPASTPTLATNTNKPKPVIEFDDEEETNSGTIASGTIEETSTGSTTSTGLVAVDTSLTDNITSNSGNIETKDETTTSSGSITSTGTLLANNTTTNEDEEDSEVPLTGASNKVTNTKLVNGEKVTEITTTITDGKVITDEIVLDTSKEEEPKTVKKITKTQPNEVVKNFASAKSILKNKVYDREDIKKDLYCGCDFKDLKTISFKECKFKSSGKFKTRTNLIEWEHVVPAENFGRSFKEWTEGAPQCKTGGKEFKGRKCAETNPQFSKMEGDLYNLFPAIGEINALRSNYQIAQLGKDVKNNFGKFCSTRVSDKKVEPRDEVKGDIARVYLYMDAAYPGHGIISSKNKKLIEAWDKLDPISKEECIQYMEKKEFQKNVNGILDKTCTEMLKVR